MDKKKLLKEYFDSVQDQDVKKFMEQCIETIPNYWFKVPASSTGKYHPKYALGNGGLMRHTIALLRFLNRLLRNDLFNNNFTPREADLLRVACLMHDSRKSGSEEEFTTCKYTKFEHPLLAAEVIRSIQTEYISDEEKEIIALSVESHMGQWNTDAQKKDIVLPKPTNKYQKIVHLVDYLAAQKGVELEFETKETLNEDYDINTYTIPFGKYKGKTLIEIQKIDSDYIQWAKKGISTEPVKTLLTLL